MIITFTYAEEFQNPSVCNHYFLDNHSSPIYQENHAQTIGIGETITKRDMETPLPFQVEEQFFNGGGHPGYDLIKIGGRIWLHLFLMGVRSNYQAPVSASNGFRGVFEACPPQVSRPPYQSP